MDIKYIELNNHTGGLSRLTVVVDADKRTLGELVSKVQCDPEKYEIEINRIRHKRGLTANAYYWALVEKISKALDTSKDEVHEELIRRYGTMKTNGKDKPVVFTLVAGEDPKQVTPYAKAFAEGTANGKRVIHYVALKGSKDLNNAEFANLLDGTISEADELGIPTMPKREVEALEYLDSNSANN